MSNSFRLLLIVIVLLAMGQLCPAASPPATENSTVSGNLRFRRVFFPEGMKELPTGNVKYLPMEADEFERMLEAIHRTAPGVPAQRSVGLVEAQYEARLKDHALLQGSATLDVSQSTASAMLMTLDPCNLVIAQAQWVTSEGAPVVLGITGNGKLQVLAERSRRMKFDWSLAGQQDVGGCVSFTLALPPSPVNRLRIELPADLTPTVDHGIVTDEGPTDLGFHRWRLELGGRPGCRLRLAKAGAAEAKPQAILASQSTTYDFTLRGVELSVKLNIEAHREPLRNITLGLDPSLELVEVSTGDVSLSWNVVANHKDKTRQVTIELPRSLQQSVANLRLRAMVPLPTAGSWKLPRILFEGVICRSSTIRLSVPSPLCIEHLKTHGCRQTGASPLKTSAGEQLDFETLMTDAGIDLTLSQRLAEVQEVSATATLLGQGKMSSRVATDFRTGEGAVFSLEAKVLPNWTIDSVESKPTDGLDDWTLERRGGTQTLSIRLARPLTSARPLRLIVWARRLYEFPGQNLGIDDLVPLRFDGCSESKRWVDLHASGANELRFTAGDRLRRANVKELTAAELDLFAELPGDLLFRDDFGTAGLRLSLGNRRPTHSATMPQPEPAIVLTAAESRSATAWVWDCGVRSQFAANGAADHVISYRIQNAGSRQIRLTLPPGLVRRDIHGIWVNDKPAAAFSGTNLAAGELAVDLPADLKFVALVLQISTHGEPLGTYRRLRPLLPDIGLPVFAWHWQLELPPGYATCSCGHHPQAAQVASFSLRRGLLGYLGRGEDQSAFNPLRREDWQSALRWRNTENYPAASGAEAETAGWTQFPIDLTDGTSSVIVIRRAVIDAGSWMLFLAMVGIGAWGLSGRPFALLMVAVMLGLPALLLPAAIAVIFSHGLLGVLFCLMLELVRHMSASGPVASNRRMELPSTLTGIVPFGAPLLAAVMLCGLNSANADETAKSAPVTHSIFIPVDEKQQPTKGKYFLPEPFFAEIYRRTSAQVEKPQGWMIVSAVYRAALADDAAQAGYIVNRLTAEFDIRVFNAAARVRIPLRREEVSLEPGQTQLDDRPVQPEWESDGSALLLEIAEPGAYRLELTLQPTVQPGSRPSCFDLAIPRVPASRFEFTVPIGGPQVEFPAALGAVRWDEVQSRWTAELGPSGRLVAGWQDSAPTGAETAVEVEQLLWLKIEPGSVLLDVRMKAKAATGQLHRLLVRADSALELLPSTDLAAPSVNIRGGSDSSRTYEIQWPKSVGSAATFDLHFLCRGTSSQGTFRVPQIDVVDARLVQRVLAVSIDPALDYQMPATRLQETGAVLEFINNWGASDTPPEMAFRLNGNAAEWNLITRARRAETSGDQNVTWSFNAQTAEVQLDAQLTTVTGSVFQYRLEVPPTLHVDSITVLAEGTNHVARWSQDQDGQVAVFLANPVSGHHELKLKGQMPLPREGKLALPQIRLEDVRIQNSLVSLYRRPDVLVEVSGATRLANARLADAKTTADDAGQGDRGRLVRSFYADMTATSPVLVTIKSNRLRFRAEQVTRVTCKENQWRTQCEYRLHVSEGLLDAIRLEIPASWKECAKSSSALTATIAAISDEQISLVLSPSAAISSDYTFTLTGPPVAAPQFALLNFTLKRVQSVKKYVVLPNTADHRLVTWALQNLRRCDLKETATDDTVKYEAFDAPWQAVLLPPQNTTATTRVVRADVRFAWQANGRCLGAAFLDVETAGAIDCTLELPDGFDLLQLTVNGLPIDAVRGKAGTWAVPLASQASASRVELLFFAKSAIKQVPAWWIRRYTFHAPKLGDLPVERIAWTIASPHTLQPNLADNVDGSQNQAPPASAGNAKASDLAAQWQRFVEDGQATVFHSPQGEADAITLDYRPTEAQSWFPRLAGIAGFLIAMGLAALLIRRGLLWNWFARWPYLFGIGVGLAWWLWLSPSAVGLLIVLAVLLRQFLPWRRFPCQPASAR